MNIAIHAFPNSSNSSTQGRVITFGKHKGKTIEQVHFIDYGWLHYVMNFPNRASTKAYVNMLPQIFPHKIKMECYGYRHRRCKNPTATKISVPVDRYGKVIVEPGAAHFWCDQCDPYSSGCSGDLAELSLDFDGGLDLRKKGNIAGFHRILRKAYGIQRLTQEVAYELFWH